MTGIIQIINEKKHTGKLLLDDGRESRIIQLPGSFESGDRAVAEFSNDDPTDTLINITVPGDKWHFGFVMIKHGKRRTKSGQEKFFSMGHILPTYPNVRELIDYDQNNYGVRESNNRNQPIKFKIRKTQDGKVAAVEISKVEQKDEFKCYQPKFGKLEVSKEKVKTGIVKQIVKEKQSNENTIGGKVKLIAIDKNENPYGIIVRDDLPDLRENNLWFRPSMFNRFYGKKPNIGDDVNFSINATSRGVQLKEFSNPTQKEILHKNQQYGIIDVNGKNTRFKLSKYKGFFNRTAEVGDIISYNHEGNKLTFKKDDSEIIEKAVMKTFENSESGKITYCHSQGYGFIKSEKCNKIFFSQNDFQKQHGKTPKKGDTVKFTTETGEKGVSVKQFHNNLNCAKSTFKNFVEIEPDALYYLYENNGHVEEVRKFNPKLKSEAISCYKDKNLSEKLRLDAIESLIEKKYEDKNITDKNKHRKITQEKLINEKSKILTQLRDEQIQKGKHQKALDYEFRLQELQYEPSRLRKFNLPKEFDINFSDTQKVKELALNEKLEISLDTEALKIEDISCTEKYLINLDSKISKLNEIKTTNNWLVDLSPMKVIKPVYSLDNEILIEIQKEY